jgi:hypothetical protein
LWVARRPPSVLELGEDLFCNAGVRAFEAGLGDFEKLYLDWRRFTLLGRIAGCALRYEQGD